MDQQINSSDTEFLWKLLANPADQEDSHAHQLQQLVNDFPQSGILRALLVPRGDEHDIKHAMAYFNPGTLYKIANLPNSLVTLTKDQIVYRDERLPEASTATINSEAVEEIPVEYGEVINGSFVQDDEVKADIDTVAVTGESPLAAEYGENLAKTNEVEKNEPVYIFDKEEYFHQDIDDEVYDEIVSIEDINLEQLASYKPEAPKEEEKDSGNIASAEETANVKENSYFVFDPSFAAGDRQQVEGIPVEGQASQSASTKDVSKYNDEKMPYTFLWWLDKTRKEHAEIYQPYAENNKPAMASNTKKEGIADELQQQYFENIFNINSVDELDKSTQPQIGTTQPERKEDKIIERFIQQEPQIQHPSGIKLDNENKAKKSSEDKDELVTETLARIYTEQMLYHKALLTYKKLMLKFPEKSLYFAGHIEQLEKKIN